MRKVLIVVGLGLSLTIALSAQVTTTTLVTDLTPTAENPPVEADGSGTAVLAIHQIRTGGGTLTGAIVDFRIMWSFGQAETMRAMHIHRGDPGVNGPVAVGALFGEALDVEAGQGSFIRTTGMVTDAMTLETIEEVLENPGAFYVNVHTVSYPGGFIRGTLRVSDSTMISTALERIDGQDEQLQSIRATVGAIARRMGIVPAR